LEADAAQAWCEGSLYPEVIKNAADINKNTTHVLLPLATWQAQREANPAALQALAQAGRVGVWLSPDESPESLQADVAVLPMVGFFFPLAKFGQPYSHAVVLRTRYGFKGELRAFGDVGRDQLFYLARCGFTQFKIKPGKQVQDALQGFADFTTPYQTSADGLLPIFAQRGIKTTASTAAETTAGTAI
jgi:uncharacterized protein (DUF934 family)